FEGAICRIDRNPYGFQCSYAEDWLSVVRTEDHAPGSYFTHELNFGQAKIIFHRLPVSQLVGHTPAGFDASLLKFAGGRQAVSCGIHQEFGHVLLTSLLAGLQSCCDMYKPHKLPLQDNSFITNGNRICPIASFVAPSLARPQGYESRKNTLVWDASTGTAI